MTQLNGFERLVLTTAGDAERQIIEKRDNYFMTVLGALGLECPNPFTEVRTMSLWSKETDSLMRTDISKEPDSFMRTDDRLHTLVLFGDSLALVFDRRNDFNNHEVTFWQNEISERCKQLVNQALQLRQSPTSE